MMIYRNLINIIIYIPLIIVLSMTINIPIKFINLILIFILGTLFINKKKIYHIFMIGYCLFIILSQIFLCDISINMDYLLIFITFIMLSIYFSDEKNIDVFKSTLKNNINKIFNVNFILMLMIIISFISGIGWMYVWGKRQFIFLMGFPHDACYFFIGLQAYFILIYFITEDKIKMNFCKLSIVLLSIFSLLTNARAPFAISIFLTIYFFYNISDKKFEFIVICAWSALFFILLNFLFEFISFKDIPIINKFIRGYEIGDITSSRDLIWENLIMHYKENYKIKEFIIGRGFGISNYFNILTLNLNLWSHNDFIEILMALGWIGMAIYIYTYYKINKVTKSIIFTSILLLVAYWNGLFVYPTFTLFIPYLILSIKEVRKYNYLRRYNENTKKNFIENNLW